MNPQESQAIQEYDSFNVLTDLEGVEGHRLLEASAGTGKTFAIEHLIIRRLLQDPPLAVDRLVVITFTTKATLSLKARLRQRIQETIDQLHHSAQPLEGYLAKVDPSVALPRLLQALGSFDEIIISTIHAFASRILAQLGCHVDTTARDPQFLRRKIMEVMQSLPEEMISRYGWDRLLREYGGSTRRLIDHLLPALSPQIILEAEPAGCIAPQLREPEAQRVRELLETQASSFVGLCDAQGVMKPATLELLEGWERCVDAGEFVDPQSGYELIEALQPSKLKKRLRQTPSLAQYFEGYAHYLPTLRKQRQGALYHLARYMRERLVDCLRWDERSSYDVILWKLYDRLQQADQAKRVASRIDLLVVDEFQDTDPVQWNIIQALHGAHQAMDLLLVGDPKQSIYAFRMADIYTYLKAKRYLLKHGGHVHPLRVNYRCHPHLIKALNHLFNPKKIPEWLSLPRTGDRICAEPMQAGRGLTLSAIEERVWRVVFEEGDWKKVAQIVAHSHSCLQAAGCRTYALLVADHATAHHVAQELQAQGVQSHLSKPPSLASQEGVALLRLLLMASHQPFRSDHSLWLLPLWRLSLEQSKQVIDAQSHHQFPCWQTLDELHRIFYDGEWSVWMQRLLTMPIPFHALRLERFLEQSEQGQAILDAWWTLIELLYQQRAHLTPAQALIELERVSQAQDEEVALAPSVPRGSIEVMTIHACKGLEYDVVYSLGSATCGSGRSPWIYTYPGADGGEPRQLLLRPGEEDPALQAFCAEEDAEKARRLYVAWTRAKEYLFIFDKSPAPNSSSKKRVKMGGASPMELYKASFALEGRSQSDSMLANYMKLYTKIEEEEYDAFMAHWQEACAGGLSADWDPKRWTPSKATPLQAPVGIKQVLAPLMTLKRGRAYGERQELAHSFTTLARPKEVIKQSTKDSSLLDPTLCPPPPRELGLWWHAVMERALLISQHHPDEVEERLFYWVQRAYGAKPWHAPLIRHTASLMQHPWQVATSCFTLMELARQGVLRTERSFILNPSSEEGSYRHKLLTGTIDAYGIYQGELLFFDWKSQALTDYSFESLVQNATQHDYLLQAQIYASALASLSHQYPKPLPVRGIYLYLQGPQGLLYEPGASCFKPLPHMGPAHEFPRP